jgi:sortase A
VQDGPAEDPYPEIEWRPYRALRDWRFYVGWLGRVLLTTGLLVLAFVAYQLWGTGIQAAQAQNELEEEFEAGLASTSPTTPPTTAPASATTVSPSATTTPPTTTTSAPPPTVAPVHEGDPLARLEIPAIGVDWIVVAGVGVDDLQKGPGHYPDTPRPGQEGNVAIAGHRTTYGAPFQRINELEQGDEIVLTTFTGRFVYRVAGQRIVPPTDSSVLDPTPNPVLTLTSCHPKYSARERIIVQALFDAGHSDGTLTVAAPGYQGTSAPDPTTVASTAPTTAGPDTTEASSAVVSTTAQSTVAPTTVAPSRSPSADALEQGWFDDADAWPHVVLWGGALALVALGAWGLGRWTGHRWVGRLAGIVPFVVVLYFFFENVNRLLPPNL